MWFHVQLTQKILNGIYQPAALSAMRKLSAETSTGINHGLLSYIDADSDQSNGLLEREQIWFILGKISFIDREFFHPYFCHYILTKQVERVFGL